MLRAASKVTTPLLTNNNMRYWNARLLLASTTAFLNHHQYLNPRRYSSSDRCFSTCSDDGEPAALASNIRTVPSHNEYATTYHAPVMWKECINALLLASSDHDDGPTTAQGRRIFVDGTLGGGGHSNALLQRLAPGDVVLGCDVDSEALATASERLAAYMKHNNHKDSGRPFFVPVQSNFANLVDTMSRTLHPVTNEPVTQVDGILLDLGVSSHQIDCPERGFAFMKEGPLDMRLDGQEGILTAADICNEFDANEIRRLLKTYGDEPRAKSIAHSIVKHRPLSTTADLVQAVAAVTPQFARKGRRMGRTATLARVFQALRIVVNREDVVLAEALTKMAPMLLRKGGRLVVLSYHSMEDRATKRAMRDGTLDKRPNDERDIYGNYIGTPRPFKTLGKAQKAREEEIEQNPRARSATLRVAERQGS